MPQPHAAVVYIYIFHLFLIFYFRRDRCATAVFECVHLSFLLLWGAGSYENRGLLLQCFSKNMFLFVSYFIFLGGIGAR